MLTDTACRNAKARAAGYRLPDAGGLHLFVTPAGNKVWRLRYRVQGKEQTLVIGPYPAIGLAAARKERDNAKATLVKGGTAKAIRATVGESLATLRSVVRRWHAANLARWKPDHAAFILSQMENEILTAKLPGQAVELGGMHIGTITPPMILTALRAVEARGALEAAHRLRSKLEAVFAFAAGEGHCTTNPPAVIRKSMVPIVNRSRRPAVGTIEAARDVLRQAEAHPAFPVTRLAFRLLALTALRPSEVAHGRWSELFGLEGDEPTWVIGAGRMKMKIEHAAPLSRQALDVIAIARSFSGNREFMFPSTIDPRKPISPMSFGEHLRQAGLRGVHVPHGWRSTFSTVMNDTFPSDRYVIDLMLAHKPKDAVERAYNRALHMSRRRELAQIWADMLMADMPPPTELLVLPIK